MDDGEIDFTDHDLFIGSNVVNKIARTTSMDSFLDELLKNTHACTHTHTCNPPGPDNTHTHTCFHTHTHLFATGDEENSGDNPENASVPSPSSGKKRPIGNKEAVKKYREKKKAHTAFLEEQVSQLRILNQQLARRLQGQAALESEVIRLRTILSEFRGRIDAELPAQRYCPQPELGFEKGEGGLQFLSEGCSRNIVSLTCDDDVPCLHPSLQTKKEISMRHHGQRETVTSCGACDVDKPNYECVRSDISGSNCEKALGK